MLSGAKVRHCDCSMPVRCSEWKELMTWPQEENGGPVAFTKDGKSVYVQSSLGYDTTRLLQVCLPF